MADPVGSVNGSIGVLAGFTITVPSTKGANPGRNLFWYERKINFYWQFRIEITIFHLGVSNRTPSKSLTLFPRRHGARSSSNSSP